jgi:hypothetical protein
MSYARSLAILFAFAIGGAASVSADEKPVEIPPDQIWSNAAPRSRSLRSLEPELLITRDTPEKIKQYSSPEAIAKAREKAKQSLVIQIEQAMSAKADDEKPPKGFAVRGVGREALRGVHETMVRNKKPENQFASSEDVSIIFLSLPSSVSVSLHRVERDGNVVRVYYFVAHQPRAHISWCLAIISLGKLDAGSYEVRMVRSPIEEHPSPRLRAFVRQDGTRIDPKYDSLFVCRPFRFEVAGG